MNDLIGENVGLHVLFPAKQLPTTVRWNDRATAMCRDHTELHDDRVHVAESASSAAGVPLRFGHLYGGG